MLYFKFCDLIIHVWLFICLLLLEFYLWSLYTILCHIRAESFSLYVWRTEVPRCEVSYLGFLSKVVGRQLVLLTPHRSSMSSGTLLLTFKLKCLKWCLAHGKHLINTLLNWKIIFFFILINYPYLAEINWR